MTMGKRSKKSVAESKPAPSNRMRDFMEASKVRVDDMPLRPEPVVSCEEGQAVQVDAPHADASGQAYALMDTMASSSNAFIGKQLRHLLNGYDAGGAPTSEDLGSALAIVGAVEPRNELEAALAVQMALTHNLAASITARAQRAGTVKLMTEYGNLATKATRTFTAQLEALTKLRSGGKQVVEHRHYNIDNRGGQAVIAEHMNTGGAGNGRSATSQSHALGAALPGKDAEGYPMPGTKSSRAETVPHARG